MVDMKTLAVLVAHIVVLQMGPKSCVDIVSMGVHIPRVVFAVLLMLVVRCRRVLVLKTHAAVETSHVALIAKAITF